MWSRRRALPIAYVGGVLALVLTIPVARQSASPQGAQPGSDAPGSGIPQLQPVGGTALYDDTRTVSVRERADAIARAQVWRTPKTPVSRAILADRHAPSIECRFRITDLGGTTPKFHCLVESGKELRVKYGRVAEVPAEAAATRLLTVLGFGADTVTLAEQVQCYGCPNEPFLTSKVVEATQTQPLYERIAAEDAHETFEWAAIEQKFDARPIESSTQKGWAFFELDSVDPSKGGAPRAHVDALRLLAVFLAHWDNKAENQRLVCLSQSWDEGSRCREPFLLLQDVGATFGPRKVDLDAWEASMIWEDRAACTISMSDGPYGGGTLGPTRVSERGRRFLARLLGDLSDAQLTQLFTWARFDKPRNPLSDSKPVAEWVRVFKKRAHAIGEGPTCPDA